MLSAKPWRLEVVIWFCAAQLVSLCLGVTMVGLLQKAGFAAFQPPAGPGAVLLSTLSFQGVTWLLIWIFLRQHHVDWRDAFGFREPQLGHALMTAVVLIMLVIAPAVWWWQDASIQVLMRLGWPVEDQATMMLLANAKSWWVRIYLGAFAVALAPVAEEFIFRGMLFPFVKQLGYPYLAWLGVSALFALIHANTATFVPLFVLALALTWLYEYTGNLLAPITAHALFNAANCVLLLVGNFAPNA